MIATPVNGRANNFPGLAKSDLYVSFLPLLTSQMVELVDQPRLIQQIVGLERRTARGGRNTIDHAPNGHDDLANVVAGVCALFAKHSSYDMLSWIGDDELDLYRQEQLKRFIRLIEAAYTEAYRRYQAGLKPDHIQVPQ